MRVLMVAKRIWHPATREIELSRSDLDSRRGEARSQAKREGGGRGGRAHNHDHRDHLGTALAIASGDWHVQTIKPM
jgi:hypothetical protein